MSEACASHFRKIHSGLRIFIADGHILIRVKTVAKPTCIIIVLGRENVPLVRLKKLLNVLLLVSASSHLERFLLRPSDRRKGDRIVLCGPVFLIPVIWTIDLI